LEGVKNKETETLKNLESMVKLWHENADQMWGKESFHNWQHIVAVRYAKDEYLKSYHEKGLDPLRVFGDEGELTRWNQSKTDEEKISPEEFEYGLDASILLHDVGNVLTRIDVNEEGELVPTYHYQENTNHANIASDKVYIAAGAEDRTKEMIEPIFTKLGIDKKLIPMAQDFVENTKYQFTEGGKDTPFAVFMRVVDQLGVNYFSEDDKRVLGLANENNIEFPERKYNPDFVVNFTLRRCRELVPNDTVRDTLVNGSWGKQYPKEFPGLGTGPISGVEIRDILVSINHQKSSDESNL